MPHEPTLIPPLDPAPATALAALERAMTACQDEAAEALVAARAPSPPGDRYSYTPDIPGDQFRRAMALMKMTAKLGTVMAQLNSHRSQSHYVHRTEVRTQPSPPPVAALAAPDDPMPRLRYQDDDGNPIKPSAEEEARYDAWVDREAERNRRRRMAKYAEEGAPSPNSSGSKGENAPRIRSV